MYNDSSSGYYTADDDPLIEEVRIYNTILLWKFILWNLALQNYVEHIYCMYI